MSQNAVQLKEDCGHNCQLEENLQLSHHLFTAIKIMGVVGENQHRHRQKEFLHFIINFAKEFDVCKGLS